MTRTLAATGLLVALTAAASSVQLAAQTRRAAPAFDVDPLILRAPGAEVGVTARDLAALEAERGNLDGGALIESVRPSGPAAEAGLQPQDVVVEFDGERVRSARQFARLVDETPPGRQVRAAVVRDGRRTELTITPSAPQRREAMVDAGRLRGRVEELMERLPRDFERGGLGARSRLGVAVHELTPQLAAHFRVDDGLLVASVEDGSPAARAGLRAGDVITVAGGQRLASRDDLVRSISRSTGEISIALVRDGKELALTVNLSLPQREVRSLRFPRTI